MNKIPLIVIIGPTAVGKTEAAIAAAKNLDGEIISADSMQIYKGLDIGTAKPNMEERQGIPHFMLDFVDPSQDFSVAQYQKYARNLIKDIYNRDKIPMLVGGTGLYINSIVYPMDFTEASDDTTFRNQMQTLLKEQGETYLFSMLREKDPITASRLHPNDSRRVIRALEIYHLTGKTMSDFKQEFEKIESPYNLVMIGLTMERQKLYDRINQRVDIMIEKGLLDEVKSLIDKGCSKDLKSMQGLGYKEFVEYLKGQQNLKEAIEILKRDTRRFAKRQFTWFRRDKRIEWVDVDSFTNKQGLNEWINIHIKKNLSL